MDSTTTATRTATPISDADQLHFKSDDIDVEAKEVTPTNASVDDEKDVERIAGQAVTIPTIVDIEHQPVVDDPRLWSPAFKW